MFTTKSFAIIWHPSYLWLTLELFKKIGAMACCHDKLGMWVNMPHNLKGSFLLSAGPCAGTTQTPPPPLSLTLKTSCRLQLALIVSWHLLQVHRRCGLFIELGPIILVWVHETNISLGTCPRSGFPHPIRWSAKFEVGINEQEGWLPFWDTKKDKKTKMMVRCEGRHCIHVKGHWSKLYFPSAVICGRQCQMMSNRMSIVRMGR